MHVPLSAAARCSPPPAAPSSCRMVRDASSLWIYNDSCARITTLPRGTFVDFTGTRQANKCVRAVSA